MGRCGWPTPGAGREQPRLTVETVLAAQPSWLPGGNGRFEAAIGAYANEHGHQDLALEAFSRAAEYGRQSGRLDGVRGSPGARPRRPRARSGAGAQRGEVGHEGLCSRWPAPRWRITSRARTSTRRAWPRSWPTPRREDLGGGADTGGAARRVRSQEAIWQRHLPFRGSRPEAIRRWPSRGSSSRTRCSPRRASGGCEWWPPATGSAPRSWPGKC